MASVEIDLDSDEFQEWYREFTTFPAQAISEAQHSLIKFAKTSTRVCNERTWAARSQFEI